MQTKLFVFVIAVLTGCLELNGCAYLQPFNKKNREPLQVVQTLAGVNETRFGETFGVAVNQNNAVFVSDGATGKIWQIEQTGATKLVTDKLNTPSQMAFDRDGALVVADAGSHTIKRINLINNEVSIIAGVENKSGFADGAASSALFQAPIGVAVDSESKIFVADTYNDKIRVIENGSVRTLAGGERGFADALIGAQAKFDTPCGIAIDKNGELLVADAGNRRIRKINQSGAVSTFAGTGERETKNGYSWQASFVEPVGITVDNLGVVYVADAGANAIRVYGRRLAPFWEIVSGEKRGLADANLTETKFNRPTSVAVGADGKIFVADSANKIVRVIETDNNRIGASVSAENARSLFLSPAQMRTNGAPRWSYDPPGAAREIAGTFGEVRGQIKSPDDVSAHFHNGLDVAGGYGETARFVRAEKVLQPLATANFGTLRELLRMPTLGYIHIRLGRDQSEKPFNDSRFLFSRDERGKLSDVRVPRGASFRAGEAIGTLNPMNHVHLIAGEQGAEMNALDGLILPGVRDTVAPTIEKTAFYNENWQEIKNGQPLGGRVRIVVRAFDQMDGNNARRRLGVYALGFQVLQTNNVSVANFEKPKMNVLFERLPSESVINLVYAVGSQSGATGDTIFNYIVTNTVRDGEAREDFFDTASLPNGNYKIRVFAADFFQNQSIADTSVKIQN